MIRTILAETIALGKRPATWILLGIWNIMAVMFGYVIPYVSRNDAAGVNGIRDLLPNQVTTTVLSGFPFFGGVIALLLAVMTFGGDYGWNVVKTLMTQRSSRLEVFMSKAAAVTIWLMPFVVTSILASTVASEVIASAQSAPSDLQGIGVLVKGALAAWLILAVWAALGALLATITKGTSLAIGLGILYGLVIEGLLSAFFDGVSVLRPLLDGLMRTNGYSLVEPLGNVRAIATDNGPGSFSGPYVGGTQALLVLVVYLAIFTGVSALIFQRRDVD
jgi:ABC-type transport system involved in multi-copper enzyme maturation permease subunit